MSQRMNKIPKDRWIYTSILMAGLLLGACRNNVRLEYALQAARENRAELEEVLKHYEDEPEKQKAARFLIENMPYYHSMQGEKLDSLKGVLASADSLGVVPGLPWYDPNWPSYSPENLRRTEDVQTVTADFLIRNIDLAFEVWKKRLWNAGLSWEEFCEFLLPYRVGDEALENWREVCYERYSFLLDSVYTGNDPVEATRIVCDYLEKEQPFRLSWMFNYPHLGGEFLLKNRIGKCREACDLIVYVLRALGIPAAFDFYTLSAENPSGHIWVVVKDSTDSWLPFNFPYSRPERGNYFIDNQRPSVIYRQYFGRQWGKSREFLKDADVPVEFKNEFRKNVSDNYFHTNLEIPVEKATGKYVCLGVFGIHGWRGVDIAQVKRGKAVFRNIGPEQIYILMYCKNGLYVPLGNPFYFDGHAAREFEAVTNQLDSVVLYRKFPLSERIKEYMAGMKGGRFEAFCDRNFHQPILMYQVEEAPQINLNRVSLKTPVRCRYVRYVSASTEYAEVAEMYFGGHGEEWIPVDSWGDAPASIGTGAYQVYDNNPLTYYISSQGGASITLDLGKTVWVDKLTFMPRNDDNFIRIGDEYELFYWGNGRWQSLGRQKATDIQLVYENVPDGALLHLHDWSRGKEELPFYMENGKQVFVSEGID